jgi:ABC-type Fe3+-hydroxamate transport system substrate-binding protein
MSDSFVTKVGRPAAAGAGGVLLAAALVLAGCGSGSPKSSTTSTSPTTSPASTSPSSSAAGGAQKMTITPATGLKTGQTVKVTATGFTAGENLVVTECANKGAQTGAGDCDISALKPVKADSTGKVQTTFTVTKGPFGANKIVCSAPNSCLISVTQETPSPSQEANAPISFG